VKHVILNERAGFSEQEARAMNFSIGCSNIESVLEQASQHNVLHAKAEHSISFVGRTSNSEAFASMHEQT
jgi:hypothetical protein